MCWLFGVEIPTLAVSCLLLGVGWVMARDNFWAILGFALGALFFMFVKGGLVICRCWLVDSSWVIRGQWWVFGGWSLEGGNKPFAEVALMCRFGRSRPMCGIWCVFGFGVPYALVCDLDRLLVSVCCPELTSRG